MDTLLSYLVPFSPIIVNVACVIAKGGKVISLIATVCGVAPALLLLVLNSGYGIGFGNPWIGVDWTFTVAYVLYIAFLLVTHALVPSSGTLKTVSLVVIALAALCTLALVGLQIVNTLEHR